MKNLKMKLLELNIKRLEKKIKRNNEKVICRLRESHMDVKNAIIHNSGYVTQEYCIENNVLFRVDQQTGECCDFLVYFQDYDNIAKIKNYLNAYLITNEDVLPEKDIVKLKQLIDYLW